MAADNRRLEKEVERLSKEKEELAKSLQGERATRKRLLKNCEERSQSRLKAAEEEKSKLDEKYKEFRTRAKQLEMELRRAKVSRKNERTAAEENLKLNRTIEELRANVKQLEEELENLKSEEKFKKWQEETQKSIDDLTASTVKDLDEIVRLSEENENLKAEITELKKELE